MQPQTKALVLSNFKYGLDTRRSELSSQPGVLQVAQDGHINAGGQFEKRKAFVRDNVGFPSITFGLQDTDQGLVTFGSIPLTLTTVIRSRSNNVASIRINTVVAIGLLFQVGMIVTVSDVTNVVTGNYNGTYVITNVGFNSFSYANVGSDEATTGDTGGSVVWPGPLLPTGVSYQYLAPPNGYNSLIDITMTAVPFSCNYKGKAFVLAQFSNNSPVFAFYDGQLVKPSRNGLVLTIETGDENPTNLSQDLADQINDLDGWVAVANSIVTYVNGVVTKPDLTGLHLLALNGSTLIYSPPGIHFTPVVSAVSTLGTIRAKLLDQDFAGSPGIGSYTSFALVFGTNGTVEVTAPLNADGTGTISLTGGPVNFVTSLSATAAAIALAINNNTFASGYTASVSALFITVFAPSEFGVVTFNLTVDTTGDITTFSTPTPVGSFSLTLSSYNVKLKASTTSGGTTSSGSVGDTNDRHHLTSINVTGSVTASVVFPALGGANITFLWEAVDNPNNISFTPNIAPAYSSAATCSFAKTIGTTDSVSGTFRCTAKDGANVTAVKTFTVSYP